MKVSTAHLPEHFAPMPGEVTAESIPQFPPTHVIREDLRDYLGPVLVASRVRSSLRLPELSYASSIAIAATRFRI